MNKRPESLWLFFSEPLDIRRIFAKVPSVVLLCQRGGSMFTVNTNTWHYRLSTVYRERVSGPTANVGISYFLHMGLNAASVVGVVALSLVLPIAAFGAIILFLYWSGRAVFSAILASIALSHAPFVTVALTIAGFTIMGIAILVLVLQYRPRDGWSGLTESGRRDQRIVAPPVAPPLAGAVASTSPPGPSA